MLGYHYEHVGLLVSLRRKGLLQEGDYFVVGIDIEQYDAGLPTKYMHGLLQTTPDPDAVEGFRHYLAVVPSAPVRFDEFAVQVSVGSWFCGRVYCCFLCHKWFCEAAADLRKRMAVARSRSRLVWKQSGHPGGRFAFESVRNGLDGWLKWNLEGDAGWC